MRLVKWKGDGHGSKPFKREFARRGNNHSAAEKCLSDRDSTLCRASALARCPFDPAAQRLRSMRSGRAPCSTVRFATKGSRHASVDKRIVGFGVRFDFVRRRLIEGCRRCRWWSWYWQRAMTREATVLDRDRDGGVECRLVLSQRLSMQLFPV